MRADEVKYAPVLPVQDDFWISALLFSTKNRYDMRSKQNTKYDKNQALRSIGRGFRLATMRSSAKVEIARLGQYSHDDVVEHVYYIDTKGTKNTW
jgi:hypothetical protein